MLKVKTKELREAVKKAKAVIKPGMQIIDTCIRFVGKGNKLMLLTNSSGVCFLTCICCECDEKIVDFIVNVNLISNILPVLQSEYVTLLLNKKKSQIIIEGGTLRLTLSTIALTSWLSSKRKKEWKEEVQVSAEELKELINRTSYASFTKDITDIRSTMNITTTMTGLYATCLDGYRIAICGDIDGETQGSFTLPVNLLKTISPFLEKNVILKKSQDEYEISDKNMIVWGKTPSVNFYNIDSFKNQCPDNVVRLSKDEFLRIVEIASFVNKNKISITIKNGTIKVSANGMEGNVENTIKAETYKNAFYNINPVFLVDVLKRCPDEEVTLYYDDVATTPLFLKGNDHENVILPVL